MGKGLSQSSAHVRMILQTLSSISDGLQWLEICLAICREVRWERSRVEAVKKGRSAGLSFVWMFRRALTMDVPF